MQEWVVATKMRLAEAGIESPDLEAQLLACHVLLVDRPWLVAHGEEPFPELAGENLVIRRLNREPLAYILGWREFYGLRFFVGPGVLIPRQETETLVEAALEEANRNPSGQPSLLDLGTGSGCVGIAIKLNLPFVRVTLSDISPAALTIAAQNAETIDVEVKLVHSDGFGAFKKRRFDIVVSNPPYIGDQEPLARDLVDYEPHEALFSGPTGYEFYQRLALETDPYLNEGGILLLEVGYTQAKKVVQIFETAQWTHIETVKDLSETPRVVIFKKPVEA